MDKNELARLDPDLAALMEMSTVDPAELRRNIDEEDRRDPKIILMQGLSEFVSAGEAQIGEIVHSADCYQYAKPASEMTFIPILYWKSRTLFEDSDDGSMGQMLCNAVDGKTGFGEPGGSCSVCPKSKWTNVINTSGEEKRRPPSCRASHNFLICVPDADEIHRFAVISFSKSSYETGTKLLNRLLGLTGAYWLYAFKLASKQTGDKPKYWVYELKAHDSGKFEKTITLEYPDSFRDIFSECEQAYQHMKSKYGQPVDVSDVSDVRREEIEAPKPDPKPKPKPVEKESQTTLESETPF